ITTEIETNHPSVKIVKTIYLDDMEALAKEIAAEKNAALTANDNKVDAATLNETAILQYYLEKYPELVGGICTNVDATQLAVKANASLKNPNSHFMLIGFDGGEAQLQSLENGEISGLVVQNPFGIGYATVVAAARSVLELGNEAQVDTGYTWVTKDNMKNENIQKMLY
ncbi:MAG: substrate-binding domain-containing protein, partial [Lachnospiraceae bacterium]|nr:substrate-binding domain-containing protein [Lachnospiraceae bacterium]